MNPYQGHITSIGSDYSNKGGDIAKETHNSVLVGYICNIWSPMQQYIDITHRTKKR